MLGDGWGYAEWVPGTRTIEEVDDSWPALGSRIRFTAGAGSLSFQDSTVVRRVEPLHRLELEAHARWAGSARVAIETLAWGDGTLVLIDEHPLTGPAAIMHNIAVDGLLRVRNRRMLRALAKVVESRPASARVSARN